MPPHPLRLLAVAALGLALAVPGWVVLHLPDEAAPFDDDVVTDPVAAPEAGNAVTFLERAGALLVWPEEELQAERVKRLRRGETWDEALAARLIADNAPALALLDEALAAPKLVTAAMATIDDDLPEMWPWSRLAEVLAVRAVSRAREGRLGEGLDDAMRAIRLGQRIERDPNGVLIHAMIGLAVKRTGLEALSAALAHGAPDRHQARGRALALEGMRTDPERWRRMLGSEYRVMRDTAGFRVATAEGLQADLTSLDPSLPGWVDWLPLRYAYKPRATWRRYTDTLRSLQLRAPEPCRSFPPEREFSRLEDTLILLSPNGLGRRGSRTGLSHFRRFELRRCRCESRISAAQVSLAVRAYEQETGSIPGRLDPLIPDFLHRVPADSWDGRPMRYEASARQVYSLGSGEPGIEWRRWKIPPPSRAESSRQAAATWVR